LSSPAPEEMPRIARRGLLLVISSPSGAGKTTLASRLLASESDLQLSISVTTRKPRPGEVDGREYVFLDEVRFLAMREAGELLEWARVFGNFYGTPRAPVEEAMGRGRDVLFDIDWQGAQQLEEKLPQDLVRVFILPPSGEALERRLRGRAQDPPDIVTQRMAEASAEISHWAEYDYVIVNADVDASLAGLRAILNAERLKRERLLGLSQFVREIQAAL
jgi:guanylate kinase